MGFMKYAADAENGSPMYRNGMRVEASVQVRPDLWVILMEDAGFEFVVATTSPGRDGWDRGDYYVYAVGGSVSGSRDKQHDRARAAFLARVTEHLGDFGRAKLADDMRGALGVLLEPQTLCCRGECESCAPTLGTVYPPRCYLDPCDCDAVHGVDDRARWHFDGTHLHAPGSPEALAAAAGAEARAVVELFARAVDECDGGDR